MDLAYQTLIDIQPTTVDGVLRKIRAWWNMAEDPGADIPDQDPEDASEAEVFLKATSIGWPSSNVILR